MSISLRPLAVAALALIAAPLAAQEQSAAPAALPPANVCGQQIAAARPAAGRLGARGPLHRPLLRGAGQPVGHRAADLPLLHPAEVQRAVPEPVGALRRREREDDPGRLPPAVEHQLPRQPVDRRQRLQVPQRDDRQDRHLQHGGAAARQDRRLRRLEEDRGLEDRREAEGRERPDPPRHVHRSRPGAQGRGDRPRHAAGEGLPVRQRHARDQGRCPAARS